MTASKPKQKPPVIVRVTDRIGSMRASGKTAAQIGRYARQCMGQFRLSISDLGLTEEEARMTQPTLPERVARERRDARREALATTQAPAAMPLNRRQLKGGIGPSKVRAELGCTLAELNRWASDGRLSADGEKFFHGVGPRGGSKWGRAWLPETLESAKLLVDEWRQQDTTRRAFSRSGLRSISPDGPRRRP